MTEVSRTVSASFLRILTPNVLGSASLLFALAMPSAAFAQVQGPVAHHPLHGAGYAPASATSPAPQTGAPVSPQAETTGKPSATIPASPAVPSTIAPVSQLLEPPKQAVIETQSNNLTIRADNASLTQTLQRIADKTGMQLEGMSGDQRVFGNFGPGTPRDVLSTLLTGTGYNILMIGALDNGAPRQLILSQKTAAGAVHQQQNVPAPDDDSGEPAPDDQPPPPPQAPPHGGMDGTAPGVRTPQQMLQQMQQMRQQADQQQANPPQ